MRKHGIGNVRDFADYAGVSRAAVYDLIRGRSTINGTWMRPSLETLLKLAGALNIPTHELLYLLEPDAPGANVPLASEVAQVPIIIAGHVGAGPDRSDAADGVTYVEQEFAAHRELVAFRVKGDSMAGGKHPIYNDDLVIVARGQEGEINMPVVVRLDSDGYVCKRLRPGGSLDSANSDFLDPELAVITPDRIAGIVGKVVRIIHTSL